MIYMIFIMIYVITTLRSNFHHNIISITLHDYLYYNVISIMIYIILIL